MGYSQHKNLPIIQIADIGGVFIVSFLVMMVNFSIYKALKRSFKEIIICSIIFTMAVIYGSISIDIYSHKSSQVKLSVVQGNILQEDKWDPFLEMQILNKYVGMTKKASLDGPDLIIWPETSFPGFLGTDKYMTNIVLNLTKEIKTPLLLGANTEDSINYFNSAVLVSGEGHALEKYDKVHLVPLGEYVPFSARFPKLHELILGSFGEFTPGKEFKIFNIESKKDPALKASFGVLICFEDIFPEIAKAFKNKGAKFLVVITNDAWYGRSPASYQHAACSVFRAIENRIPVVRCANTGYSCFIDRSGQVYDFVSEKGKNLFVTGHKTALISF